jgi:hypothetical protein
MPEERITEAQKGLLAWAENHRRALSDLRELESLGINPERAIGLLVYGEDALRREAGADDPEEVVAKKLPAVLRRNPFSVFSPRTLWRLHELLAEAGDVVISAGNFQGEAGLQLVFSANVKRAGRRELSGKVVRRLFNEARAPVGATREVDAARKELCAIVGALLKPPGSRVNEHAVTAAVAAFLKEECRRERPAKRTRAGAIEADERVATKYGLHTGENLRKFLAAARKKSAGK